jgi:hypothetical protein
MEVLVPDPNSQKPDRWKWMVGPIATLEDADRVVRESAKGYFTLAAIQAVLAFFLNPWILVDAGLVALGGLWLLKSKSRVAACLLLGLGILEAGQTFLNKFAGQKQGGTNVFLAVIVVWVGIRAVQATFRHHQLSGQSPELKLS